MDRGTYLQIGTRRHNVTLYGWPATLTTMALIWGVGMLLALTTPG